MVTVKRGDKGTEWAVDDRHSRSSSFPPWPEGTGPRHEGYEGASDTRNEPFSRGMLGSDSHPSRGTTSMSDRSETEGAPLLRGSLRSHSATLRDEERVEWVTRDGRDQKWWRRKSRPSYRSLSSTTLRFAHCNDYRGKRLVSWAKPFLYEWSEGSRERLSPVIIRREPSRPQARRPRMTQNKIQYYMKWGTGGD